MTVDGSGRSKPDAEPLDIEQQQQDGAQEPDPTPTPVGTFDPDTVAGAQSEEGGNGGGQG